MWCRCHSRYKLTKKKKRKLIVGRIGLEPIKLYIKFMQTHSDRPAWQRIHFIPKVQSQIEQKPFIPRNVCNKNREQIAIKHIICIAFVSVSLDVFISISIYKGVLMNMQTFRLQLIIFICMFCIRLFSRRRDAKSINCARFLRADVAWPRLIITKNESINNLHENTYEYSGNRIFRVID